MIEQSGTGPWVFVNTKVSVNIAYTGEEGSTQRGAQRCVQTTRTTTSVGRSHTMSIQVAHGRMHARIVHKRIAVYKQRWALVLLHEKVEASMFVAW
jgi:hypothetical protein